MMLLLFNFYFQFVRTLEILIYIRNVMCGNGKFTFPMIKYRQFIHALDSSLLFPFKREREREMQIQAIINIICLFIFSSFRRHYTFVVNSEKHCNFNFPSRAVIILKLEMKQSRVENSSLETKKIYKSLCICDDK